MKFYEKSKKGMILNMHIVPNAKKTEICGEHGDALKVKLKAPPVDGKANKELLKFLKKQFRDYGVNCELVSGLTSRSKRVLLRDFFGEIDL